jgi:hypothetical protein
MIVGSMTQFLTKAQGMPKPIENAITKLIRNFIWNERRNPPISSKRLEHPVAEGRIGLLNIKARNEVIEITWIKTYINVSNQRPSWAYVTDAMINYLKPINKYNGPKNLPYILVATNSRQTSFTTTKDNNKHVKNNQKT